MDKLTMNEKAQVKEFIYKGEFEEAKKLIKHISLEDLEDFVLKIGFDDYSLTVYGFILSMLLDEETAELHSIASVVLSHPLCHYEGAYSIGLYHALRAVELDDINVEYKQFLLLFHDIPEHLLSAKEAIEVAKQILAKDPKSLMANDLIDYYKKLLSA